jgi:FkbM family methyltransferase
MVHEIFYERVYTPPGLEIDIHDVVVDIGANVGVFTLFAARNTQETVYAFEPIPLDIEFLHRNILKNRLRNVVCIPAAVCDRAGSVKLYLSEACSGTLFDHNIRGKLEQYIQVPATTLQEIMDRSDLRRIDFLKLDCEGAEGLIFRSTPTSYLKRIRKIAMEFHDNASALKHDELRLALENAGFATRLKWSRHSPFGYLYGKRD